MTHGIGADQYVVVINRDVVFVAEGWDCEINPVGVVVYLDIFDRPTRICQRAKFPRMAQETEGCFCTRNGTIHRLRIGIRKGGLIHFILKSQHNIYLRSATSTLDKRKQPPERELVATGLTSGKADVFD
jgi:hypothetical protein